MFLFDNFMFRGGEDKSMGLLIDFDSSARMEASLESSQKKLKSIIVRSLQC